MKNKYRFPIKVCKFNLVDNNDFILHCMTGTYVLHVICVSTTAVVLVDIVLFKTDRTAALVFVKWKYVRNKEQQQLNFTTISFVFVVTIGSDLKCSSY